MFVGFNALLLLYTAFSQSIGSIFMDIRTNA